MTLAHVLGRYDPNLFIKLSDIPQRSRVAHPVASLEHPSSIAPPWVRSAILTFLVDHPHYEQNCFLIMPFAQSKAHVEIAQQLKVVLKSLGFNLVRADERAYSEDLLTNIEAYNDPRR